MTHPNHARRCKQLIPQSVQIRLETVESSALISTLSAESSAPISVVHIDRYCTRQTWYPVRNTGPDVRSPSSPGFNVLWEERSFRGYQSVQTAHKAAI